jgi:hypothetical protein
MNTVTSPPPAFPSFLRPAVAAGAAFAATTLPAAICDIGVLERPNLKGFSSKPAPGVGKLHPGFSEFFADGASRKWDVSRQMQWTVRNQQLIPKPELDFPPGTQWMVNQPKAVDSPVMFPKNPVEGNDDPILTPPRFDETSDPYVAVTNLGEDLNHAVGELTSNDTPALNVYDIFAVPGRTFAKELDFREFMRLELSDGSRTAGRFWFRISDYKEWHHYMKVEFEAGTRSWKNAGSISALTAP